MKDSKIFEQRSLNRLNTMKSLCVLQSLAGGRVSQFVYSGPGYFLMMCRNL